MTDSTDSTTQAPQDGAQQPESSTIDTTTDTDRATTEQQPDRAEADKDSSNAEAGRYRRQLRAAERERDTLAERVTAYQRRECEAAVADLRHEPADIWEIGKAELAQFYSDDGALRDDELRAAAGALIEQRPRLAKSEAETPQPRNWGQYGAISPAQPPSWGAVIGPR